MLFASTEGLLHQHRLLVQSRGAVSALTVGYNNDNANILVVAHGANRGIGIAVQATTNYMMLERTSAG